MTEPTIEELSQAFFPCTLDGLADEWRRMNNEIADIRKQRDNIEAILLDHCERTGEVIEGKTVAVYAHRYVAESQRGVPVWKVKLEVKKDRTAKRLRIVKDEGASDDE